MDNSFNNQLKIYEIYHKIRSEKKYCTSLANAILLHIHKKRSIGIYIITN